MLRAAAAARPIVHILVGGTPGGCGSTRALINLRRVMHKEKNGARVEPRPPGARPHRTWTGRPSAADFPAMTVVANGKELPVELPCTLEQFLVAQGLPPRCVVVEQNGEAVAPSEFPERQLGAGDRLEIVRIVAGG